MRYEALDKYTLHNLTLGNVHKPVWLITDNDVCVQ